MSRLSRDEKNAMRPIFLGTADKRPCEDCGGLHERSCRRVKRKTFHPNGNLVEVEYWPDGSWDEGSVIWSEDVFDPDDED